ncbi:MAG: hypothetical protein ABSD08_08740 [Xanthobacteraceae bacterium]|jgi:hypothetical protein
MKFKLGKKPARAGAVRLKLANYTNVTALPPLPATFGHETIIGAHDWGMLANDRYGDCVWAGAAHETMMLAKEGGDVVTFTDANVLSDYAAVTGFNPADPSTDQGTDMQDAAAYRRKTGIIDATGKRNTIAAYLALEPGNVEHLYQATYLFGAAGIGLQLPSSALAQSEHGQLWDVVAGAPVEGGHYVPLVGRSADGLDIVTWGAIQVMTEAFLKKYCDEAIAYVSQECLVDQKSPEGFAYADLISDLAALA